MGTISTIRSERNLTRAEWAQYSSGKNIVKPVINIRWSRNRYQQHHNQNKTIVRMEMAFKTQTDRNYSA
jgi:hypothetical protein